MEWITIEELMANLADEVTIPDIEHERHRLKSHIRTVFREIGHELVCGNFDGPMEIKRHYLVLPTYVISMQDVGFTRNKKEGYQFRDDLNTTHPLAYTYGTEGVYFKNTANAKVHVWYYGLNRDNRGYALIPEVTYEAVHSYCLGKLLANLPLHPRYNDRFILIEEARRHMALARVELNQNTSAKQRVERQYLGGMNPQTTPSEDYFYRNEF